MSAIGVVVVGLVCFFVGVIAGSYQMYRSIKDRFDKIK